MMMGKITLPNDVLLDEVARLVDEGEAVTLMTKGASMLPFIVGGRDSVLLVRPEELFPGMIVLAYVQGGRYVLHRILSVDGTKVVLMGDGNIKGVEVCAPGGCQGCCSQDIKAFRRGGLSLEKTSQAGSHMEDSVSCQTLDTGSL